MSRHAKTQRLIEDAYEILAASGSAMTVRQVYYRLVSRQVIENSRSSYQAVSNALVVEGVEQHIDLDVLEETRRQEADEKQRLVQILQDAGL